MRETETCNLVLLMYSKLRMLITKFHIGTIFFDTAKFTHGVDMGRGEIYSCYLCKKLVYLNRLNI